jgi:UDP-glucose 4-epimerase
MRNLLITGGSGFIGYNFIQYLIEYHKEKFKITVIDNLSVQSKNKFNDEQVEFIEADILDKTMMQSIIKKSNCIVHLAADTTVMNSITDPSHNFNVNVVGTFQLLKLAQEANVEHFILASTGGAILGEVEPPVTEAMAPRPLSPYGASKLCAEGYCSAFSGSYGMKTVALRFSNVYGPHSFHKTSVVANFFKNILNNESIKVYGDGEQTRDYIYVGDLCQAIYQSLNIAKGGEVFQLGSGKGTSINTLIKEMEERVDIETQLNVEYRDERLGEIKYNYTDISKAKKFLNYKPTIEIDQGLKRTWNWFKTQIN